MSFVTVSTVLLIMFSMLQNSLTQDPCLPTTYRRLDDPWRSTEYDNSNQCDGTLTKRWYRPVSGAGVTMPTAPPPMYKCGTQNPVWMDDTLPDTSDITEVKVCVRTVFSPCFDHWNIRVKNCSSFYVYELTQTNNCPTAYCFGSELICPAGQTSYTGFSPGCGVPPNVTLNAVVIPGLSTLSGEISGTAAIIRDIVFQCDIEDNNDVDLTGYVYDVQWYINDNNIASHRNIPYANFTQTMLRQSEWIDTFKLGFLVKCAVRARAGPDGPPAPYNYSSDFYAGFTTDDSQYTVKEGGSVNVIVRLTIPIDCSYPASSTPDQIANFEQNDCSVTIRLRTPTYYEDGQIKCTAGGVTDEPVTFQNENCGVVFPFNDWSTPRTIQVFGAADNTVNEMGSRTSYIRFRADGGFLNPAWALATKPDIQIVVEDQDINLSWKQCIVRTDPNVVTLDGRRMSFQQYGEFILFKHETLPIRIHAIFDRCPEFPWLIPGSCTCGIAIRNQDTVFIINLCRNVVGSAWISGLSNTNRYIEMRACDDSNMVVTSRGSSFQVTLPSGTVIDISHHSSFIRWFSLKPSLSDWKSSSGLCGYLDGTSINDFRKRDGTVTNNPLEFGWNWRLDTAVDGNSLFAVSEPLTEIALPPLQYCKCSVDTNNPQDFSSEVHCNITSTITACSRRTSSAGYVQECDKARTKREAGSHRFRRSVEEIFDVPKFDVILDGNYTHVVQNYTWVNGWTESLAEQSCREAMNNDPMLIKCKEVLPAMDDTVDEGLKDCINDIKISGGTGFLKDTVESLKSTCIVEASRFENLTSKGSGDGNGTTFLDDLLVLSCPNDCSEHGNCVNGNCECYTDFFGDDCALKSDSVPEIFHQEMACSTDKKPCTNFVISGSNFLDINLTCQARLIKVYKDRWEVAGTPIVFPARHLNSINCVCIIPDSVRRRRSADNVYGEGYLISISNDGINFSNETTIVTYDSTCYTCDTANISCTQLESCATTTTLATATLTDITATKTTSLPTEVLTSVTSSAADATGSIQPSSTNSESIATTIQPSPASTYIGTVTINSSPAPTPSGTVTIPVSLATTTSGRIQNPKGNNGEDLALGAIIGGIAAVIIFICLLTTAILCWNKSKCKANKINQSIPDMTECPDRERYKAELNDYPDRPSTASSIRFQLDKFQYN